ncbi:MAG: hypothetical protein KAI17_25290 [Thiotrichaceae bacterium]|nr:hypothetical protein [Thiotrichaceae bacterium]
MNKEQARETGAFFCLSGFDCDNGSEFLNYHLLRYFTEHPDQPLFTRSRPYKKNDNANEWSLLQNHFCPTMKLLEKKRIGARYQRKYPKPETPYARVIASDKIKPTVKEQLIIQHENLNPFALKQQVEAKLKLIFSNVSATSNVRLRI